MLTGNNDDVIWMQNGLVAFGAMLITIGQFLFPIVFVIDCCFQPFIIQAFIVRSVEANISVNNLCARWFPLSALTAIERTGLSGD